MFKPQAIYYEKEIENYQLGKELLEKYKEGLILGSACEQGELYRAIVAGESEEEEVSVISEMTNTE